MKKVITVFVLALMILFPLGGCSKDFDYTKYISEKRTNIYLYEDDTKSVKIHISEREQPYAADGIKGDMNPLCEIFVTYSGSVQTLYAEVCGHGGDMNYKAVDGLYYLSFSADDITGDSVQVALTADGNTENVTALSVLYDGVMSCEDALRCTVEHDKTFFDSLTEGRQFGGEIYVRLLVDENCYYYVGVCEKSGDITAYLVDGVQGKVIATKKLKG